jgi:hypothetical protein
MSTQFGLDSQPELQTPPAAILQCEFPSKTPGESHGVAAHPELSIGELAFRVRVAFRVHPHLSNVLTHISGASWAKVEQSLNSILDLTTTSGSLSSLDQNIIDLMSADRGITGRIMKPYFRAVLRRVLEPDHAERLISHIDALSLELEWKAQHPTPRAPTPSEPLSQEPVMPGPSRNERVIKVADIDPRHRHTILLRSSSISLRMIRCRSSSIMIPGRCACSWKRITARAATGHTSRKDLTSGAFACVCWQPRVALMAERPVRALELSATGRCESERYLKEGQHAC